MIDTYKTITEVLGPSLYKEKGSKFYGYAFPVTSEEEINRFIKSVKEEHHKARHWCYAWRIGTENFIYRVNDDGEPSNSAGQPIYGQILSKELTNVLVVVVRYFGGVKLGVGGLVNAYKTTAQWVLDNKKIVTKTINKYLNIRFDYKDMNKVQRIIKTNNLKITQQDLALDCQYTLIVRKRDYDKIRANFKELRCVFIKETDNE